MAEKKTDGSGPLGALKRDIKTELDQTDRELEEISLMLEQSQLEVNKLAQKNASATANTSSIRFDAARRYSNGV